VGNVLRRNGPAASKGGKGRCKCTAMFRFSLPAKLCTWRLLLLK
jgi:hypothetical protein